jgi:polyhydroxyalkanoate synthase
MKKTGYLDGSRMATAFNMLRASDLIWPYVVNNYLKGKDPMPFDLLYWNSDATRMPAANHSYYLRNCYLENNLSKGKMELAGKTLHLADIKIPIYNLAAREDHIAPARSAYIGGKLFGGNVTYVMSGSGHIAGVVNPPAKRGNTSSGAMAPKMPSLMTGLPAPRKRPVPGGRTGMSGSRGPTIPRKSLPESPAARNSS